MLIVDLHLWHWSLRVNPSHKYLGQFPVQCIILILWGSHQSCSLSFLAQPSYQSAELLGWSVFRRPSVVRPSSTITFLTFFFKTGGQILFKLGGDVSWVDPYQVCSIGHAPVIFLIFLMNFFFQIFKNLLQNCLPNCFEITQEHTWGLLNLNLFTRWRCDFSPIFFPISFLVNLFSSSPEWKYRIDQKAFQFRLYT